MNSWLETFCLWLTINTEGIFLSTSITIDYAWILTYIKLLTIKKVLEGMRIIEEGSTSAREIAMPILHQLPCFHILILKKWGIKLQEKINRTLERINASLINAIIFCIGVISLFAAFFIINLNYKNVLISVGCSLIASSIVSYLTSKYLMRMSRVKRIIEHWGLEAIFETRQEMNRSTDRAHSNKVGKTT